METTVGAHFLRPVTSHSEAVNTLAEIAGVHARNIRLSQMPEPATHCLFWLVLHFYFLRVFGVKIQMLGLLLLAGHLIAQDIPSGPDHVSPQEWQREEAESVALAVKLYPELGSPSDKLQAFISKIWPDPKLFPRLSEDSFAPLFYATVGAEYLNIPAHWPALSDAEKTLVFQEMAYHSKLVYQTVCGESHQIDELSRPAPYVSSATSSFNPDAISNPWVRETFSPQSAPSQVATPTYTPDNVFPPPTTTIIDPQTGDTAIVTH